MIAGNPDAILITGDISISKRITYHLSVLERIVQRPIYFVLGNHDYYNGSIENTRVTMKELSNMSQYLKYLPTTPYVALSNTTAIVGHDCWYDAGYGDVARTNFAMRDWSVISEFASENVMGSSYGRPNYEIIKTISKKLAYDGVIHIQNGIKAAAKYHKIIVIATHFPPFEEAHIYNGSRGGPGEMPWYTNKMLGDMLKQAAESYPKVRFEVFAGHTHGKFDGKITKNLYCHVGGAMYSAPKLQTTIELP